MDSESIKRSKTDVLLSVIVAACLVLLMASYLFVEEGGFSSIRVKSDPISIEGDEALAAFAGGGMGAAEDPFVIEGLKVDASQGDGVYIRNTTLRLTIRNIEVYGGFQPCYSYFYGIRLENVSNCLIESCIFDEDYYGVFLDDCANVSISSTSAVKCGFDVWKCERIEIADSRADEVDIRSSKLVSFEGNHLQEGIVFHGTEREHFDSHTISSDNLVRSKPIKYFSSCSSIALAGSDAGQIIISGSRDVDISGLEIEDARTAVQLAFVDNFSLRDSTFASCFFGIKLSMTTGGSIVNNTFVSCVAESILIEGSANLSLLRNSIFRGSPGVWMRDCEDIEFGSNRLSSCYGTSLRISESERIAVNGNTFVQYDTEVGSPFEHIGFWEVNMSSIENNTIGNTGQTDGHYWAVTLTYSNYVLVANNSISDECTSTSYSIGVSYSSEAHGIVLEDNLITGFDYSVHS